MQKITEFLDKNVKYAIYAIAIICLFGFFRGCSARKDRKATQKEMIIVQSELDSLKQVLNDVVYRKDELKKLMEIEGLKTSKRTLYDWNAIVRTAVRPDDRMNEYDIMIESIEKDIE